MAKTKASAVKAPQKTTASKEKSPKKTPKTAPSGDVSVKLLDCFMRDASVECFLPPAMQPDQKRELDFSLSTAVRPVGENVSCVGVAIRVRIHMPQQPPFLVAEMIEEGIFNTTCENDERKRWLGTEGASQVYDKARKVMLGMLAEAGVSPPIPSTIDFAKVWDENTSVK